MATDPQVQKVKDATDIGVIIGERITLKPSGRNLKGLCPFHGEKSPSFYVTPDMQIYKCFGCGEGGDVFNFLEKFDGMGFAESLEYLASRAGITLEQGYKKPQDQLQDTLLEILHLASEFYHYLLTQHPIGQTARDYAQSRGIYNSTIKDFKLGYAPQSWSALTTYLTQKKHYQAKDLELAGLSLSSQRSHRYYDRFRGRLIFPLKDPRGHIVGFSGRLLSAHAKEAKYINSPETQLYHKAKLLFGYNQARTTIRQKDRAVIVEGELDVISSHQVSVKEVVAVKGSSLTLEQVGQLKRLTKNLYLSLDADAAGQEAIRRAIALCEQHELNLRIIHLAGGKDPDELIKQDPQLWKQAINQAKSVYQFYLDYALAQHDPATGEGQKAITQYLVPLYAQIQNAVEQAYYVNKLADVLQTTQAIILQEINKFNRTPLASSSSQSISTQTTIAANSQVNSSSNYSRREKLERYLLALVMQFEAQASQLILQLQPSHFQHHYLAQLTSDLQTLARQNSIDTTRALIPQIAPEKQPLIQQLFATDQQLLELSHTEIIKLYQQALQDLEKLHLKESLIQLAQQLNQSELDEHKRQQLQAEYQNLSLKLKN